MPEISISLDEIMALFQKQDPIDKAIESVMQWPMKCPGPCFPLVYRGYMSHPAFLLA